MRKGITMKKKIFVLTVAMATVATMFTACGTSSQIEETAEQITEVQEAQADDTAEVEAEVEDETGTEDEAVTGDETVVETENAEAEEMIGDEEWGDYPSNEFESRVGKTSFDSYDEIIGLLEGDEVYAYVDVMGYDGQVLLIADFSYEYEAGVYATTDVTAYTMKNGVCTADTLVTSGGTATPLMIDDQGVILTASHSSVERYCYGENGTGIPAMMMLSSVYATEFDDNGDPTQVSGFVRTVNSLVNDDMKDVEADDIDTYNQMFDEYCNATVIGFTRVSE